MIEKIGPTIYKGESIYKTGGGGGGVSNNFDIGQFLDGKLMPDGRMWATKNLIFAPWPNGAEPYNEQNSFLFDYGIYMNFDAIQFLVTNRSVLCPGWNVPTRNELLALFNSCNNNFNTLNGAGFNIQLGGGKRPDNWEGRTQYEFLWSRSSSSIGGWHAVIQSGLLAVSEIWGSSLLNVRLIKDLE